MRNNSAGAGAGAGARKEYLIPELQYIKSSSAVMSGRGGGGGEVWSVPEKVFYQNVLNLP